MCYLSPIPKDFIEKLSEDLRKDVSFFANAIEMTPYLLGKAVFENVHKIKKQLLDDFESEISKYVKKYAAIEIIWSISISNELVERLKVNLEKDVLVFEGIKDTLTLKKQLLEELNYCKFY